MVHATMVKVDPGIYLLRLHHTELQQELQVWILLQMLRIQQILLQSRLPQWKYRLRKLCLGHHTLYLFSNYYVAVAKDPNLRLMIDPDPPLKGISIPFHQTLHRDAFISIKGQQQAYRSSRIYQLSTTPCRCSLCTKFALTSNPYWLSNNRSTLILRIFQHRHHQYH